MRAAHIRTDGTIVSVDLDGLEGMQRAVGGYLEAVSGNGWYAYANEEGAIRGRRPNPVASEILGRRGLVGDVIIFGGIDDEGQEISLTDEDLGQLLIRQARQSVIDYFHNSRRGT